VRIPAVQTSCTAFTDGAFAADLATTKRSSPSNRRSKTFMVSSAWTRFSGCRISLSVRKVSIRKEPDTLTALARPLMSSAITVDMTMETKESSARALNATPTRMRTESRRNCEKTGKMRFTSD
jgi:hypothetical protein